MGRSSTVWSWRTMTRDDRGDLDSCELEIFHPKNTNFWSKFSFSQHFRRPGQCFAGFGELSPYIRRAHDWPKVSFTHEILIYLFLNENFLISDLAILAHSTNRSARMPVIRKFFLADCQQTSPRAICARSSDAMVRWWRLSLCTTRRRKNRAGLVSCRWEKRMKNF